MALSIKRILIGRPIATERAEDERLPKILALPIFASDALSSVAYATEAIMVDLLLAGAAAFVLTPWLSLGIVVLLGVVAASYRQTIMAYPSGGGAYTVARDNLGEVPAQAAGAALLVDYVLTVSVSVAAGVQAVASLLANNGYHLGNHQIVLICVACVCFIAVMNLRGVRESGVVFAIPTYSFITIMYVLLGVGFYKLTLGGGLPQAFTQAQVTAARTFNDATHSASNTLLPLSTFLILRAFASGCTAMTGVEAISNGVTAFREPATKNAATTMMWMASLLVSMFLGLSYLAIYVHSLPSTAANPALPGQALGETVLSQVGRMIFNNQHSALGNVLYWFLQIATALILILAANTSFAGFPRLSAIMARDGFLPRQFANIGDKLVFDRGIIVLSVLSTLLIVIFGGRVDALIPLYAIGVFLSFTLSQSGMVKRWFTLQTPGWKSKALVNGVGAVATFVVMIVFGVVKFMYGAWVVVFAIPILVCTFTRIHAHYRSVAKQLSLEGYRPRQGLRHHVLVLAPDIHRGVIPALQYARSISADARAIHVSIDPARERRLRERWMLYSRGLPLEILPSPYRSLAQPVLDYINRLQLREPRSLITLVIPEFVPTGWWPKLLHGQAGLMLTLRLRFKPGVVVISIPYHIESYVRLPVGSAYAAGNYEHDHGAAGDPHPGNDTHSEAPKAATTVTGAAKD